MNSERIAQALALIGHARRARARTFNAFCTLYMRESAPPAVFHRDMEGILNDRTRGNETDKPQGEGGGDTPQPTRGIDNTLPTSFLQENVNSTQPLVQKERLLFMAPRGFAKSRICSVYFPIWLALNEYRKDIFIVSATIAIATEQLRIIRTILENNTRLLNDFGDQKSDKWTEDEIHLKNGVIIRAKGKGFQIRGFRPDIIICDDLEDEEEVNSKERREKNENWFYRTLLPALQPKQTLLYVGTNLHQFSLISKLSERPEFLVKKWVALQPDGTSLWEERFPAEVLRQKRAENSYAFEAEYQNNPISLQDQPIKPYMLEGVRAPGDPKAICLAIDPAISEKTSADERAFCLFCLTGDNSFRELYSESGRWGIEEQIEHILGIFKRFSTEYPHANFRVVVESVAFQKVFKYSLTKEAQKRGMWLPVIEAELGVGKDRRPKDKFTRLMQVVHLFEQGLVEVRNPNLKSQLLAFPHADHDDLVDATVFALYWLMKSSGEFSQKKVVDIQRIKSKRSFYMKEAKPGVFIMCDSMKDGEPEILTKTNFHDLRG